MLSGTRVTIGPIFPEDFGPLFCWANDVGAARLDVAYRPVDLASHRRWCENIGSDPAEIMFAIRRINEAAIIGYIKIMNIDCVHRSAVLGIRIGEEKNRGQGYGRQALQLALTFCWSHANLNRIQLTVVKHNQRAVSAYKAVGFKREGLLRKAAFFDGRWNDLIVMAALRPPNKKKRALAGLAASTAQPSTANRFSSPNIAAA